RGGSFPDGEQVGLASGEPEQELTRLFGEHGEQALERLEVEIRAQAFAEVGRQDERRCGAAGIGHGGAGRAAFERSTQGWADLAAGTMARRSARVAERSALGASWPEPPGTARAGR